MEGVLALMSLTQKRLTQYKEEIRRYKEWKEENPQKHSWEYEGSRKITPTEIKRLLLVLRQETRRFESTL